MKNWLLAARPKTLGAAVAPVLIGSAFAGANGVFHALSAVVALWGALWIQIGTNLANDYFDFKKGADTEERVGPTRATAAGLIAPEVMKRAFILAFGLVLPAAAYLVTRGGWPIALVGLSSIALGILYTATPWALGYKGTADIVALLFFGPIAVGGTYWVQSQTLPRDVLIAGCAPGLLAVAMLTVNNLRDRATDAKVGKKTLAVRFGPRFARWEFTLALLGGCLLPLALGHWLPALVAVAAIPVLRTVWTTEGGALNKTLGTTGKLMLAHSALFALSLLN
jgi:1,4-dihydroxy-2-naphthoate octaprenyltransferase